MSQVTNILSTITKDLELKASFLSSLKTAKPKLGDISIEKYWFDAISHISQTLKQFDRRNEIDEPSLRAALMQSSEYGLCFNPKLKECYLEVVWDYDIQNIVSFDLGLKYNGLKSRLVKTCNVVAITTEVVHQNDTFEWRGQWKEPFYIMSNEPSEVLCCFGVVELASGRFMAYKLSKDEMLALEEADKQRAIQFYGDEAASFYTTAYRNRMFEIATLRYLYRELVSLLSDQDETDSPQMSDSKDHELAKEIERELEKSLRHAS